VLIGITGLLAVVMLVICGIKMMTTEAVSSKSEAKQCITNAIFGVIIALAAYLILNTINPKLLSNSIDLVKIPEISVAVPAGAPGVPGPSGTPGTPAVNQPQPTTPPGFTFHYQDTNGNRKYITPTTSANCEQLAKEYETKGNTILKSSDGQTCIEIRKSATAPMATNADETSARQQLCGNARCAISDSNPSVNNTACPTPAHKKGCTNIVGIPTETINVIKNLASQCSCKVIISGGTERGHSTSAGNGSHYNPAGPINSGVFDLRYGNNQLDSYIKSNGQGPVTSFGHNKRWLLNGYWFTWEQSAAQSGGVVHWHVCKEGLNPSYCQTPR
jgi:hypothetical protein